MRPLFLLSLLLASVYAQQSALFVKYNSTAGDIILFLRGLSKGLVGEDLGQDLGMCFQEGSTIADEVQEAILDIEKGGLEGIVNGIFKIVQIITEVPQVFSDCKQVSTSAVEKILAFSARFSDYNALLSRISMNLLWHGTEIYSDAALAG